MTYNRTCPACGKENRNLYLDETDGWMICEYCGVEILFKDNMKTKRVPILASRPKNINAFMRSILKDKNDSNDMELTG